MSEWFRDIAIWSGGYVKRGCLFNKKTPSDHTLLHSIVVKNDVAEPTMWQCFSSIKNFICNVHVPNCGSTVHEVESIPGHLNMMDYSSIKYLTMRRWEEMFAILTWNVWVTVLINDDKSIDKIPSGMIYYLWQIGLWSISKEVTH